MKDPHKNPHQDPLADDLDVPDLTPFVEEIDEHGNVVMQRAEDTHGAVEQVTGSGPEAVLAELESEGVLPHSPHMPVLGRALHFLERAGIRVVASGKELTHGGRHVVNITNEGLLKFLTRGGIAASFLAPFFGTAHAAMGPGQELVEQGSKMMEPGIEGNTIYHIDVIILLILALLGIGSAAAYGITKKLKKDSFKDKKEKAKAQLDAYNEAKKAGNTDAIKSAKEDILGNLQGELPADMEAAVNDPELEIKTQEELDAIFKLKKEVDEAINAAIVKVESKMILPPGQNVKELDSAKNKVVAEFMKQIAALEKLLHELGKQYDELYKKDPNGNKLLLNQIAFEKKKLHHILNYLHGMKKLFLILIQEAKNAALTADEGGKLSPENKGHKELADLKKKLNDLLDAHLSGGSGDLEAQLAALDKEIDDKEKALGKGQKKTTEVVGFHELILYFDGMFTHETGVHYELDGELREIALLVGFEVQIWVDKAGSIFMNFTKNGKVLEKNPLTIAGAELMVDTGEEPSFVPLGEYLEQKQAEFAHTPAVRDSQEAPEAQETYAALVNAVKAVQAEIANDNYSVYGKHVVADDETIEYHLIRVHREYHGGKAQTVVRFTLTEGHWKQSLAHLSHQKDVPQHTVPFAYENEQGVKQNVGQEMIKFNVQHGALKAQVLIPKNSAYRALQGEVRIILGPSEDAVEGDMEALLREVVKKLGIETAMKPETPATRAKLQNDLRKKRRGNAAPVGANAKVHNEYAAEIAQPATTAELMKLGLHSVYHQFHLQHLDDIFKSRAILSTTTRWAKGSFAHGMSSFGDVQNGGATEAFTRIHTKESAKKGIWYGSGKPALVFGPRLLQRMDCYCYAYDKYGSKLPDAFNQRISPEQLVKQMAGNYQAGNEVMFFDGVDVLTELQYVVCSSKHEAKIIIDTLKKLGIHTIGGKPLQQAVVQYNQFPAITISV